MQKLTNNLIITFIIAFIATWDVAQTQRPSFAGLRPPGLNQKDKYHMNNNNNSNNTSNTDITNRFGQPEETTLSFGAAQKPPASYIPVIFPESNYLPLPATIGNRFGSVENTNAIGAEPIKPTAVASSSGLPIDAHGDTELVAILSRLPKEQQPFWFLNAAAIEAQRNGSFANYAGAVNARGSFFG